MAVCRCGISTQQKISRWGCSRRNYGENFRGLSNIHCNTTALYYHKAGAAD